MEEISRRLQNFQDEMQRLLQASAVDLRQLGEVMAQTEALRRQDRQLQEQQRQLQEQQLEMQRAIEELRRQNNRRYPCATCRRGEDRLKFCMECVRIK